MMKVIGAYGDPVNLVPADAYAVSVTKLPGVTFDSV